jgi:uncharacterized protein (TIGR03066 family)
MQMLRWTLTGFLIVSLAGCGKNTGSNVQVDKEKLLGVWELTKTTGAPPPPAGTSVFIEFLKDGKMKDIHKEGGQPETTIGTRPYEVVDGNMLKITNESGGGAGMLIEKLTDTELAINYFGEVREYKKKK